MISTTRRSKDGNLLAVAAVLLCAVAAGCSATADSLIADLRDTSPPTESTSAFAIPEDGIPLTSDTAGEFEETLPDQVSLVPGNRPGEAPGPTPQPERMVAEAPSQPLPGPFPEAPAAPAQANAVAAPAAQTELASEEQGSTDADAPPPQAYASAAPAQPEQPKRKSFLSSFFGKAGPRTASVAPSPAPMMALASLTGATEQDDAEPAPPRGGSTAIGADELPGVRMTALFEIRRGSGSYDDSDVDLHEQSPPIMMASAAGLARLAPNGLIKQTDKVDVACLKPALVRVLKSVERHYGKKVVVTSGYRSPGHNRRARGARNSLHMYCAAADVQVEGVTKWQLAQYVRSMPGRGGVGTYCHTNSVHVDVGPERDWNWRCRRRR